MADKGNRANRDENGKFVKGNNANPSGRPKIPQEVKNMFKAASPKALEVILKIMNDENAQNKDRKDCAIYVLDKTFGKNFQVFKDEENGELTIRIVDDIK